MSGLEGVGVAASILQVADIGLRLSKGIYDFADSVASADSRLTRIGKHVDLTSEVVKQVADVFSSSVSEQIVSRKALKLGQDAAAECGEVFGELMSEVSKLKKGKRHFYKFPFKEDKLLLMESRLEKLKSTLNCLMNVLLLGKAIKENKDDPALRKQIAQLALEKDAVTKKYEALLARSKDTLSFSPAKGPLPEYYMYQGPPADDKTNTNHPQQSSGPRTWRPGTPTSAANPVISQKQVVADPPPSTNNSGDLNALSVSRLLNAPSTSSSSSTNTRGPPNSYTDIARPLKKLKISNGSSKDGPTFLENEGKGNAQHQSSQNPRKDTVSGDTAIALLEDCASSVEDLLQHIEMVLGRLRRQSRSHVNMSEVVSLMGACSRMNGTMSRKFQELRTRHPRLDVFPSHKREQGMPHTQPLRTRDSQPQSSELPQGRSTPASAPVVLQRSGPRYRRAVRSRPSGLSSDGVGPPYFGMHDCHSQDYCDLEIAPQYLDATTTTLSMDRRLFFERPDSTVQQQPRRPHTPTRPNSIASSPVQYSEAVSRKRERPSSVLSNRHDVRPAYDASPNSSELSEFSYDRLQSLESTPPDLLWSASFDDIDSMAQAASSEPVAQGMKDTNDVVDELLQEWTTLYTDPPEA